MSHVCELCNENVSKYKCSTCFIHYCSVNCWKAHKNENNCKVKEEVREDNIVKDNDRKKYFTEDTVDEERLRLLGDSKTLKNILSNRHLQKTLKAIDISTDPEAALKQAMKDPEFAEFVDECLKIVED